MQLTVNQYETLVNMGLTATVNNINGFAEACFDQNSFDELINYSIATADTTDMETWDIDESEWRDAQKTALQRAMFWFEDEQP